MKKSSKEDARDAFQYTAEISSLGIQFRHLCTPFSTNKLESHDDICELTVYTESGKSLYVGTTVYITNGVSAFTFRPGEPHFGIHKKDNMHERYVIHFPPDRIRALPGGLALLRCFFDRRAGEHNMIVLPHREEKEAMAHLENIFTVGTSDLPEKESVLLADFIMYLSILNRHYLDTQIPSSMPGILHRMLVSMEMTFLQPRSIQSYADEFNISQSTMERLFRETMCMTPVRYLRERRMEHAKLQLRSGCSVTDACYSSGFNDYSHFIADFKKHVGVTPAKYKNIMMQRKETELEDGSDFFI